ncbi:MAG TPA: CBS domain-containing protein [Azospirillaceae bacterium]|nr:CBS domain-containing protein [Azospirillaceae bacterium]HRQ80913.1 CBS domain-containing protein [Azospirillaceae bacterium]
MPKRKLMPDVVKGQELACVPPSATVRAAVRLMAERHISAILVTEDGRLKGIFTERDLAAKVVAQSRDVDATLISAVMTANPDTLPPDATALEALDLMESRHYRHMPLASADGVALGMVSIRDLFPVVRASLEEEIKDREAFMFGASYSAGASA